MERYFRLFLLSIFVMFGIIPIAQAEDTPFEWHAPFPDGETYDGGGNGSYYNQGKHTSTSKYCIDFNQGGGDDDKNNPVTAIAGGIVVADQDSDHEGYHTYYPDDVAILHEGGYYSLYMHLNSNSVSVGDEVRAGQVIGKIGGQIGYDPHLHFCIFNSSGQSVMPTPMDGTVYDDNGEARDVTSNNREVTEEAFNAIKAKEAVLYADDLIDHQTEDTHWYGGTTAQTDSFIIKDWDGGSWGWVAITFDPSNVDQERAYVLRHSFWTTYRNNGGPDHFGAPIGDEMDMTREDEYDAYDPYCTGERHYTSAAQCITEFCGATSRYSSVQRFEETTLCWDRLLGYACEAGFNCAVDIDPSIASVPIIDPSSFTYTSLDLTGQAPVDYTDLSSSVTCAVDEADSLYVVLNGQDGRIYEFETVNDGITWTSTDLSAQASVPYSAMGTSPHLFIDEDTGDRYVTFMGSNARIQLFHYNGTSWSAVDLTGKAPVPYADPTTSPYGYIANGLIYVVFQGNDQRIWRFTVNGSSYSSLDLSGRASVQYAMPGTSPMGIYNEITNEHHIVFQGINQRIQRLTDNGSSWSSVEITSVINSDLLDSSSSPYTYVDPFTGYVYTVINGVNERIDLIADYHTSWDSDELTSLISVPLTDPGSSPTGYIDPFTGNHVITLTGDDLRINQFEGPDMTAPTNWTSIDQTSQAAVEYAAPGTSPATCVDPITGVRHTVFVGENARVQYLRYGP